MKSIILTTIALLFSSQAFAMEFETDKVMEMLLSRSRGVKVFTKDETGEKFHKNLPEMLAEHMLVNNHLMAAEGSTVVLTNTSLECESPKAMMHSLMASCQLMMGSGDYEKKAEGYMGPDIESGTSIEFIVRYNKATKKYRLHRKKAYAVFAG